MQGSIHQDRVKVKRNSRRRLPARHFLELLDPNASEFTFQLATDAEPKPQPDPLARTTTLPPNDVSALKRSNEDGAAVWVMINEGDGRAKNVVRVRAVFADVDGQIGLEALVGHDPKPHIVVESSPKHYQAYWLVDGLPLEQFKGVQRRIAQTFGTDHVVDLCRVMRVPGFLHQKNPNKPFRVRIAHKCELPPYPAKRILQAFPPLEASTPGLEGNGLDGELPPLPEPLAARTMERYRRILEDLGERNYPSASERDATIAYHLLKHGKSPERAVAWIRAERQHDEDGDPKRKGDNAQYLWRTVGKAREELKRRQEVEEEEETGLVEIVPLASYASRPVKWLLLNTVALNMFNLWSGEPDMGKSTMLAYLTAIITTGGTWPDGSKADIGEVLILTEDPPEEIVRPRLEAAGADLSKVYVVGFKKDGVFEPLASVVDECLDKLDEALSRRAGVRAVFIDPIFEYVENVRTNSSAEIRQRVMRPLTQLARKHGVAIIAITHPNKNVGQSARMRVSGGDAWVTAAQIAFMFGEHPSEDGMYVMAPIRNKLSDERGSWIYRIESVDGYPVINCYERRARIAAEELVQPTATLVKQCEAWLQHYLAKKPMPAKQIKEEARKKRFKHWVLNTAKRNLGVRSVKDSKDLFAGWMWKLT